MILTVSEISLGVVQKAGAILFYHRACWTRGGIRSKYERFGGPPGEAGGSGVDEEGSSMDLPPGCFCMFNEYST